MSIDREGMGRREESNLLWCLEPAADVLSALAEIRVGPPHALSSANGSQADDSAWQCSHQPDWADIPYSLPRVISRQIWAYALYFSVLKFSFAESNLSVILCRYDNVDMEKEEHPEYKLEQNGHFRDVLEWVKDCRSDFDNIYLGFNSELP